MIVYSKDAFFILSYFSQNASNSQGTLRLYLGLLVLH